MQTSILTLFLVLAGFATLIFVYVFMSSKRVSEPPDFINPQKVRFWFSLILLFVMGILASITIPKSPYYLFADESPSAVIHVMAYQFAYIMSENAIDPQNPIGNVSISIPQNEVVEFRVTSMDVNHGFAIYDSSQKLIAQTQAMPGYVNKLRWKFTRPGIYNIYCLEYCGLAHQAMKTSFTVKQ